MVITILSEPRSGSTNLANWFKLYKDFTVFQEPLTNAGLAHLLDNGQLPAKWEYSTKYLVVKEIFGLHVENMCEKILNSSDKIILLYRENEKEQLESWVNSNATGVWHDRWIYKEVEGQEAKIATLKAFKEKFKTECLATDRFRISYEDLYYRGKFQKVLDYLEIPELKNKNFPLGYRYRKSII